MPETVTYTQPAVDNAVSAALVRLAPAMTGRELKAILVAVEAELQAQAAPSPFVHNAEGCSAACLGFRPSGYPCRCVCHTQES